MTGRGVGPASRGLAGLVMGSSLPPATISSGTTLTKRHNTRDNGDNERGQLQDDRCERRRSPGIPYRIVSVGDAGDGPSDKEEQRDDDPDDAGPKRLHEHDDDDRHAEDDRSWRYGRIVHARRDLPADRSDGSHHRQGVHLGGRRHAAGERRSPPRDLGHAHHHDRRQREGRHTWVDTFAYVPRRTSLSLRWLLPRVNGGRPGASDDESDRMTPAKTLRGFARRNDAAIDHAHGMTTSEPVDAVTG